MSLSRHARPAHPAGSVAGTTRRPPGPAARRQRPGQSRPSGSSGPRRVAGSVFRRDVATGTGLAGPPGTSAGVVYGPGGAGRIVRWAAGSPRPRRPNVFDHGVNPAHLPQCLRMARRGHGKQLVVLGGLWGLWGLGEHLRCRGFSVAPRCSSRSTQEQQAGLGAEWAVASAAFSRRADSKGVPGRVARVSCRGGR